jgi:hypothetical protein
MCDQTSHKKGQATPQVPFEKTYPNCIIGIVAVLHAFF